MKKILISVVVVLVFIFGTYFLLKKPNNNSKITETTITPVNNITANEVIYTNSGYTPNSITISVGETVTFKNESTKSIWTASATHPSHIVYDGTSLSEHCPNNQNNVFDTCKGILPSDSWSFTFNKAGSLNYHNHLNPSDTGKIIVQ